MSNYNPYAEMEKIKAEMTIEQAIAILEDIPAGTYVSDAEWRYEEMSDTRLAAILFATGWKDEDDFAFDCVSVEDCLERARQKHI